MEQNFKGKIMASPKRRRLRKQRQLERLRETLSEAPESISYPDPMSTPSEEDKSILEVSEALSEHVEEEVIDFDSMTKKEIIDWLADHEVEADMTELKKTLVKKAEVLQNV